MPEKEKNTLKFRNFHKQMKAPFIIYADFEALIKNIPERERERTSCTEKTDKLEATKVHFYSRKIRRQKLGCCEIQAGRALMGRRTP